MTILLEITFEADIGLVKPIIVGEKKLLIKRPFFLVIYLALLSQLATHPASKERVLTHCQFLFDTLRNSYWNYSLCTRVSIC